MSDVASLAPADVSVIIPAKNSADSIPRALRSVLNQSQPVREIIVVDDDSTDATRQIASGFAGVTVLPVAYSNRAQARNAGVGRSSGAYLAFLDSDDEWHADKIREQLAFVRTRNLDLGFHDFSLLRPDAALVSSWATACRGEAWYRERERSYRACDLSDIVGHGDYLFTSSAMISRRLWQETGGMRREFERCQDVDLWLRCHEAGATIGFLPRVLATKHGHRQITGATTYWYRLRLLDQSAMRLAPRADRADDRRLVEQAYARDQRSFAGWARRQGQYGLMFSLYLHLLLRPIQQRLAVTPARSVQKLGRKT